MDRKRHFFFTTILLVLALLFAVPSQHYVAFATGDGDSPDEDVIEIVEEVPVPEKTAEEIQREKIETENAVRKNKIDSINKDLDALKAEQTQISKNIGSAKGAVAEKQAVVSYIDNQIYNTQSEISLLESKIGLLGQDIGVKEVEIEEKNDEYDKNYDIYLSRLREMYMYDNSTTLGLILGADDFVDFLTTADMLSRVADHDQLLMEELISEREALEAEKKSLGSAKDDLEESSALAQEKRQELNTQHNIAAAQVQDVLTLQKEYEADLASSKAKSAAMQSEINRIFEQIKMSEEAYVGGEMAWPVPNYYQITSRYGWRFGGSDYHTGMDISGGGVHGKPVVAANDGSVVAVNWSHTPGRGYGIYVILDHGGNISTLYGHLNNISVSMGQAVTRGQTIGAVGTTGWSTGPHLHFEVRLSGKHVNPESYVT